MGAVSLQDTDNKAYHGNSVVLKGLGVVMTAAVLFKSEHFVSRNAHAIGIKK